MSSALSAEKVAQEILAAIRAAPSSVIEMRRERRRWSTKLKSAPAAHVVEICRELLPYPVPRWIAYELVAAHPTALSHLTPASVEELAGRLDSWSDVDQFSVLLAGPAWRAGSIPTATIHEWAGRPDPFWRQAALVATVPLNVRSRGGTGDVERTLAVCDLLIADQDNLVVKALSWALRELVVHNAQAVNDYLTAHDAALAPRVRREVRNKLTLGLKYPRPNLTRRGGPLRS